MIETKMTKCSFEENEPNDHKMFENLSEGDLNRLKDRGRRVGQGIRRTLTMINLNRKRIMQSNYNKKKRTRRLSFLHSKKIAIESPLKNAVNISTSLPFIADQCKLKTTSSNDQNLKEISKPTIEFDSKSKSIQNYSFTSKKPTFRILKRRSRNNITIESLQSIRKQSILNIDQQLKEYIEKQSNFSSTDTQVCKINLFFFFQYVT